MENKYNVSNSYKLGCLALGVFLAISSSVFTVYLLVSRAASLNIGFQFIFAVVAICFDLGGKILVFKGAYYKLVANDIWGAFKLYFLGLCFILVSLGASQALTLNLNNTIRNEQLTNSDEYKEGKTEFNSAIANIETYQAQLNDKTNKIKELEYNKNNAYKAIENKFKSEWKSKIDSARNLDYITTPKIGVVALEGKRDSQIEAEKQKYDNSISTKKTEKTAIETKLKTENINKNVAEKKKTGVGNSDLSTNGTDSLSQWLSDSLGFKDVRQVDGWLNFVINLLIEVLAVVLMGLAGQETKQSLLSSINEKVDGVNAVKSTLGTIKRTFTPKKKVGFNTNKAEDNNIIGDNIDTYSGQKLQENINNTSPILNINNSIEDPKPRKIGFQIEPVKNEKYNVLDIPKSSCNTGTEINKINEPLLKHDDLKIKTSTNHVNCDFNNEYSREDIKKYLKFMYENRNGLTSPGQTQFKKHTNLSDKAIRGIRYFLTQNNVISIQGTSTKILIESQNDALKIIKL